MAAAAAAAAAVAAAVLLVRWCGSGAYVDDALSNDDRLVELAAHGIERRECRGLRPLRNDDASRGDGADRGGAQHDGVVHAARRHRQHTVRTQTHTAT